MSMTETLEYIIKDGKQKYRVRFGKLGTIFFVKRWAIDVMALEECPKPQLSFFPRHEHVTHASLKVFWWSEPSKEVVGNYARSFIRRVNEYKQVIAPESATITPIEGGKNGEGCRAIGLSAFANGLGSAKDFQKGEEKDKEENQESGDSPR